RVRFDPECWRRRAMNHPAQHQITLAPGPRTQMTLALTAFFRNWLGKSFPRARLAALVFLVWTAVGLFEALPETLINSPWPVFLGKVFDAWAWALLTPAIMLIDRKFA